MGLPAASLDDRLDAGRAPAWRPQPGEKLVGEVVSLSEGTSSYDGRRYPIVTVRCEQTGADFSVHALHQVLVDELAIARPKVAERLGIKYEGEITKGRNRYKRYRVVVDRPDGGVDWGSYGEGGPESSATPACTENRAADSDSARKTVHELPPMRLPADPRGPAPEPLDQGRIGAADDDIPF